MLLVFLSTIYLLSFAQTAVSEDITDISPVKVSIYYEVLCPDSQNFYKRQFYPVYKQLKTVMDVDLVPYGKAIQNYVDGKWIFECQHGPDECYSNKVQGCVLRNNSITQDIAMDYFNCIFNSYYPFKAGESCANKYNLNWRAIQNCASTAAGDSILAEYGKQTHAVQPRITFVPTIIYNDTYDRSLQTLSLRDFKNTFCSRFVGKLPEGCRT